MLDIDSGELKRYWGAYGNEPDDSNLGPFVPGEAPAQQFRNPVHCAEPSLDGMVYVCDRPNNRLQVFKQDGTNVAYTLRLKYTGIPGVEFGLWHNHQSDLNNTPGAGNIPADLWGGHINMSPTEGFGFRAFGGTWQLDCSGTNAAGTQHACATNGREKTWGAFVEPSYRWSLGGPMDSSIGIGARAGAWNDKADELQNASNKIRQYDLLLNYWLSPNAVLKVPPKTASHSP